MLWAGSIRTWACKQAKPRWPGYLRTKGMRRPVSANGTSAYPKASITRPTRDSRLLRSFTRTATASISSTAWWATRTRMDPPRCLRTMESWIRMLMSRQSRSISPDARSTSSVRTGIGRSSSIFPTPGRTPPGWRIRGLRGNPEAVSTETWWRRSTGVRARC